ncbi:ABC transporter ATP-binding protein [Hymenobacter segetis]|uniref:ABC transporter ATP-binding protein n=1 Tax=Hymenobacter segetis TaxID=2025509 RepID=A0ABU9M0U6_9BACT
MIHGIIPTALRSVAYYVGPKQRRQAAVQFGLLLVSSVLDVFGLASLVPVLLVAAQPGGVRQSPFFFAIYQYAGFGSERTFLVALIAGLLAFFLLKNLFSTWVNYIQARFTAAVGLEIIQSQLRKYLHLPFWYLTDFGSANLINSAVQVPSTYVSGVVRPLFTFFSELTVVLVIGVGILLYKPILLVILLLVLAPAALLTYRALRTRSRRIGNELNELRPASFSIIQDLFAGFVELKLAGRQGQFAERLLRNQAAVQALDAEAYLYALLPVRVIEMVAIMGVLTIFLYSLYGPVGSGGLLALVGTFAAAAYRLMPSVNRMFTAVVLIKQNQYALENLELFRGAAFDETPPAVQLPLPFRRELVLDDVSFTFPDQSAAEVPVLQHISLRIGRGEKIGFVGSSGSGKTTLMNVLLRFYREQHGRVLVDGQALTPQHLQAWYELVGYVRQDTFLMEASIQDNVTLGAPAHEVDAERLRYAIAQASLADFVAALPRGLATLIGERGAKLSGGQRQRIGIARALYKQAEILLLDEATSALDNETEREVNEAITHLAHTDMTILIIAHRLTTLRECDRIYDMRQGRIVGVHRYDELPHSG